MITLISLLSLFLSFSASSDTLLEGSLTIRVTHCASDKGLVRLLLYNQPVGFPENVQTAIASYSVPIKNRHAEITLEDLPAGEYAISVFHDEDEDGELEKHLLGFPTEKYGFSNNPKITFSAPTFDRCSFELKTEEQKHVQIKLR